MINPWVVAFLSVLGLFNLVLLAVVAYSAKGQASKATKIGFAYMAAVLALDMFALFGGVKLW